MREPIPLRLNFLVVDHKQTFPMYDCGNCYILPINSVNYPVAEDKMLTENTVSSFWNDTSRKGKIFQPSGYGYYFGNNRLCVKRGVLLNVLGDCLNILKCPGRPTYYVIHFFRRVSASSWVNVPCSSATWSPC